MLIEAQDWLRICDETNPGYYLTVTNGAIRRLATATKDFAEALEKIKSDPDCCPIEVCYSALLKHGVGL